LDHLTARFDQLGEELVVGHTTTVSFWSCYVKLSSVVTVQCASHYHSSFVINIC